MVEIAVNREYANTTTGGYIADGPVASLVEDVNLNNNRLFIASQAYDVNSLSPIYGKKWNYNSQNLAISLDSIRSNQLDATYGVNNSGWMFLYNGSVQCLATTETSAGVSARFNKFNGHTYHLTCDPQNFLPRTAIKTSSNNILYLIPTNYGWVNTAFSNNSYAHTYVGTDITAPNSLAQGTLDSGASVSTALENIALYEDPYNDVLWMQATNGGPTAQQYTTQRISYAKNYYNTADALTVTAVYNTAGYDNFWMGNDNYNNPYFFRINKTANNDPVTVSYISSQSKAGTDILTAQLPATSYTANGTNSLPSNVRTAASNRKVFYTMHYDSTGAIAPVQYVWDPTTPGSVTKTNCTMTYPGSNTFFNYAVKPVIPTGYTTTNYSQGVQYCKPYQFSVGSNNYITFIHVDAGTLNNSGFYNLRFSSVQQRTWVTYQLGSSTNDYQLTFHSALSFPTFNDMPRAFLPTTYNGTTMAVATAVGVKFYSFNLTTGWAQSGLYTAGGPLITMGLDQTNRLWGIFADRGCGTVHIITPQTPVTLSMVLANSTYNYTGSTISTTAALNAYDTNGNRYVANVTVTIDGSTMTFANGAKTGTFTTSNSADTTVSLSITGGGINNLTTSINI
jgi:hypothetical protein